MKRGSKFFYKKNFVCRVMESRTKPKRTDGKAILLLLYYDKISLSGVQVGFKKYPLLLKKVPITIFYYIYDSSAL